MDIKILIKNLTWFNLVEKLKVILNKLVASAFIDAPIDGNQYVRQDGAWEEFTGGGVPTLQQVTESGNTTDQVIVSSNNIGILSSLVRTIQNINVVNTTGVRLFNTGAIQIQSSPSSGVTIYADNTTTNRALQVPDDSGTLMVSKYKVYTALLTQSGTSAPVATVLENTLGGVVNFTYNAPGTYDFNVLTPIFTVDKSTVICTRNVEGAFGVVMNGFVSTSTTGSISVTTSGTPLDDHLLNAFFEIRVYN